MSLAFLTCGLLLQTLTPEIIEHAQAGAAAQQQGHLDIAIQEFRKVTELQPNSAAGHANLGDVYFQSGDYTAAIPELKRALDLNPKLMGTHQTLGVALLVEGNAEAALPHLELTRTPELLGLAYLETGRLGSAVAALQTALERQPNDVDLLYYFGQATALASKRTAAQLLQIERLRTNGGAPSRCTAESTSGNPSPSPQEVITKVASLQKALAGRPDDPDLLCAFSHLAAQASANAFDGVLRADPNSARAHQVSAERYADSGRLPDAEREYSASLRLKPYAPNVHFALGNLLAKEGNAPGAIEQFRLEARLRPQSAEVLYRLGFVLLDQGQARAAAAALAEADRLQPNTPQILMALGNAALAANDSASAEASWVKLLALDQKSELATQAHFALAALYRKAGKSAEADLQMAAYRQLKNQGANPNAHPDTHP